MKVPKLDPRFGKLVALMEGSTHEAERASARRRAEAVLSPDVGDFDRALRILAYEQARASAPNNMFAGFDEHTEIDNPGHMARQAKARAERLKAWHARRAVLVERYGSLAAVEAPCQRELAIRDVVKPWRVRCKSPYQRWTLRLEGWDSSALAKTMPADLRAAVEGAYPMPATFTEAKAELAYWRERNEDLEHALGENGSFLGDYGLDRVAVARMEIVRDLVDHQMVLSTLPEIIERMRAYRFSEGGTDEAVEDALLRDLEALASREVAAKRTREVETRSRPSLRAFLEQTDCWIGGRVGPDVVPWMRAFVVAYEAAVEQVASVPRHHFDDMTPNRDKAIKAAFDALMRDYRSDPRRKYLGSMFLDLTGSSIRQAFSDHVEATAVRYAERSNA